MFSLKTHTKLVGLSFKATFSNCQWNNNTNFQESSEICADNHTTCVNENIDAVKEVFDEETCLAMLVNYYEVFSKNYLHC